MEQQQKGSEQAECDNEQPHNLHRPGWMHSVAGPHIVLPRISAMVTALKLLGLLNLPRRVAEILSIDVRTTSYNG